jgi:hypothetical protein
VEIAEKGNIKSLLSRGYVDPGMKVYGLSGTKVINDLCNKFQLKKASLVPLFKPDRDEEYLKNLNFVKLREDVMKEHQRLEKHMRNRKNKKLTKWKLIKMNTQSGK